MDVALSLLLAYALILWILVTGAASCHRLFPKLPAELRLVVVVAAGILLHALLGWFISIWPGTRLKAAGWLLSLSFAGSLFLVWRRGFPWRQLLATYKVDLLVWVLTSSAAIGITYLPAAKPPVLFDGPYVFKKWFLPVQIQSLALHYPLDNALPSVVTEYLVRDVPFAVEHPVLPGQEVSNRPILMSFAAVPLRVLSEEVKLYKKALPRFVYGDEWPNTEKLLTDEIFRKFLVVGIVLNAALTLAVAALLRAFAVRWMPLHLAVFTVFSPYLILHTFFTWPKNLAAFFIIAALLLLRSARSHAGLAGVMIALAYWSHPYAISFVMMLSAWVAWLVVRREIPVVKALQYFGLMAALLAPWFIWSRVMLGISSDIVQQNFNFAGGWAGQVWARMFNAYLVLCPSCFHVIEPKGIPFLQGYLHTLAAPLGLTYLLMIGCGAVVLKDKGWRPVLLVTVLSGLFLLAVFSQPGAVVMAHGWQAVWPVLFAATLFGVEKQFGHHTTIALTTVQLLINIAIFIVWGATVLDFSVPVPRS